MVKIGRQKNQPNTLVSPAPVGWRTLAEKVYCSRLCNFRILILFGTFDRLRTGLRETDTQPYIQTYIQTDRRTDRWTDRRTYRWTDGRTDRQIYGRTDGWMDGRTDRRTDGQTYGRTDGHTDRQTDKQANICVLHLDNTVRKL